MLGKASIIGAVAAILITPTPVSAQMGGVVDPGVQVGGAVNPRRYRSRCRRARYSWPGLGDLAVAQSASSPYSQA
jgi:hypothetical protein